MATESPLRVPMLVPEVDVRGLPLGALEGFLLSRIDGELTLTELGEMTGLGTEAVTDIVVRLVSLNAVAWRDARPVSVRPPRAPAAERNPARSKPPERESQPTPLRTMRTNPAPANVLRALYDPSELEEDVDLERERRRQILDTFYHLDTTNYYQLLEVAPDADKKEVRDAYFQLSKIFHPDTMFRKRLGTYKQKMEVIFRRLTEAYETLNKKKTREAYDDYLSLTEVTQGTLRELAEGEKLAAREAARVGVTPAQGVPASVRPNEVPPPPVTPAQSPPPPPRSGPPQARASAEAAASPTLPAPPSSSVPPARSLAPLADSAPPGASAPPPPPAALPPPPPAPMPSTPASSTPAPSTPAPSIPAPPTDDQRRRMQELLQYRLQSVARDVGASRASGAAPAPAAQPSRPADPQAAGRELVRTLQQTATVTGGSDLASRNLVAGLQAEREGKLVEAVNALGVAHAVAGEREDVLREYTRVKKLLAVKLADTYAKQARYEEELGKWGQATLSWARVCEGRPDDLVAHQRTAEGLLKSNGDLHRARSYAQRAVELSPDNAKLRALLGRVFIAAGLKLNAKRELEIAAKLDPADDLVKNLLRDLK